MLFFVDLCGKVKKNWLKEEECLQKTILYELFVLMQTSKEQHKLINWIQQYVYYDKIQKATNIFRKSLSYKHLPKISLCSSNKFSCNLSMISVLYGFFSLQLFETTYSYYCSYFSSCDTVWHHSYFNI